MSEGLYSRLCALNSLNAVFENFKPLDESLDKNAEKYKLSAQDKAFAHALCGYVLRYKDALQDRVNKQANRTRDIDPPHLNTLMLMGTAQIYLMDGVANHAAVSTSVDLAVRIKCPKQKGLVNGLLRNLIRGDTPSLKPSLPEGLVGLWADDYGDMVAKNIEHASLQEAKIGIANKDGKWAIREEWSDLTPDEWVQDYSSHKPVSLLDDDLTGVTVLDLCAAPGGKTMQLAAKGASVTSVDISEKRLKRLHENLQRTGLTDNVTVVCADILKYKPEQEFDIVLLDAPCSATGTIRRHPDLPYIRGQEDMEELVKLQEKLLFRAKKWVKSNGTLVYCTCSLQKSEGEYQIDAFLEDNPMTFKKQRNPIRLLPNEGDRDGFFISFLTRK